MARGISEIPMPVPATASVPVILTRNVILIGALNQHIQFIISPLPVRQGLPALLHLLCLAVRGRVHHQPFKGFSIGFEADGQAVSETFPAV